MTSRGPKPPIFLPPIDPTLQTRPVPRERHFAVRSFGPGSLPEAQQDFLSYEGLIKQPADTGEDEWVKHIYQELMQDSSMEWREDGLDTGEPTWGPVIIVTAYSEKASEILDRAIINLVETINRYFLRCSGTGPFAREAYKRLELKVLEDRELLEHASDDRVREEFNAYVRTLRLFPADLRWEEEDRKSYKDDLNRPHGPLRYGFCIVLDEETIENLATITFPKDLNKDKKLFKDSFIKLVERRWRYPKEAHNKYGLDPAVAEVYGGTDMCPLLDLPLICADYHYFQNLDDMFPLRKWVDIHG